MTAPAARHGHQHDGDAVAGTFPAAAAAAALAALLLSGCASLGLSNPFSDQPPKTAADAAAAPASAASAAALERASWRLEVDAPPELRTLLVNYLDLSRFQAASGDDAVTPSELARLVALAPAQARSLLETEGYFNADVTVERVDGTPLLLRVHVAPGPRTTVGAVSLRMRGPLETAAEAGDARAAEARRSVVRRFPLKTGDAWRQPAWSAAKVESVARLRAEGYAAGTLAESRAQIDAAAQRAQLDLLLDSGPLFLLGDIRVEGLQRYREPAVRNVAGFIAGEPYSEQKLQDYQERLGKANLFESVSVTIDPDPSHAEAAPVRVRVRELPLQQATFGVGYSANTGQRFTLEHTHRRVFGQPWRARSKLEWGRDLKSIGTELTSHPLPNNWRNLAAIGIEDLLTTDQERKSGRLRIGRGRETKEIDRLYYLELTRSNLHDNTTNATTNATALSANYEWVLRYVDNVLLPTRGVAISAQLGGGYSDSSDMANGLFSRAFGRLTYYQPFGRDWYSQTRIEAGQVFAPSNVGIPDPLLFRAGGDNSVRGYSYRSLGPTKNGALASGRVLLTASAEVAHPISPKYPAFLWALFADAGNAADSWNGLHLALGYGAGLRWRSPVGPLRVDLAYGQDVHKARLHLSVGVAF